jgi:predicted DNA-binding transcriptional regulator YafY
MEDKPDGSLNVRFRAGGMLEMCWHLFRWGDQVEVLAPYGLRKLYGEMLRRTFRSYAGTDLETSGKRFDS